MCVTKSQFSIERFSVFCSFHSESRLVDYNIKQTLKMWLRNMTKWHDRFDITSTWLTHGHDTLVLKNNPIKFRFGIIRQWKRHAFFGGGWKLEKGEMRERKKVLNVNPSHRCGCGAALSSSFSSSSENILTNKMASGSRGGSVVSWLWSFNTPLSTPPVGLPAS